MSTFTNMVERRSSQDLPKLKKAECKLILREDEIQAKCALNFQLTYNTEVISLNFYSELFVCVLLIV